MQRGGTNRSIGEEVLTEDISIDGLPIYRQTFKVRLAGGSVVVPHGIANLKAIWRLWGTAQLTADPRSAVSLPNAAAAATDLLRHVNTGANAGEDLWYAAGAINQAPAVPAVWPTAFAYAVPFVARGAAIDRVQVFVTTASAGQTGRVGIYDSVSAGNLWPGAKLYESANLSLAVLGHVRAAMALSLRVGAVYWAVYSQSDSVAAISSIPRAAQSSILGFFDGNGATMDPVNHLRATHATYADPLPAFPAALGVRSLTSSPAIFMRYSA